MLAVLRFQRRRWNCRIKLYAWDNKRLKHHLKLSTGPFGCSVLLVDEAIWMCIFPHTCSVSHIYPLVFRELRRDEHLHVSLFLTTCICWMVGLMSHASLLTNTCMRKRKILPLVFFSDFIKMVEKQIPGTVKSNHPFVMFTKITEFNVSPINAYICVWVKKELCQLCRGIVRGKISGGIMHSSRTDCKYIYCPA